MKSSFFWKWLALVAVLAVAITLISTRLRWRTLRTKPTSAPSVCGLQCGSERWSIKTLSDEQISCVNFTPRQVTISWLVYQQSPERLSERVRSGNIECQTWQITGRLVGFKAEEDRDLHIVIADLEKSDLTIIVEIPDPACGGACASLQLGNIAMARNNFIQAFGEPPRKFRRLTQTEIVTVTGVGFFDFRHGQIGSALNGVELHPVLTFAVTNLESN